MFARWIAIGSALALVIASTALVQAQTPAAEDLASRKPVSIDTQVAALTLKDVASFSDNISTRTVIRFSGQQGTYEVRPGTDVLVQLAEGTRNFKFTPAGFRAEAIGGDDDDSPVFHYVRLEWSFNGAVRWTM